MAQNLLRHSASSKVPAAGRSAVTRLMALGVALTALGVLLGMFALPHVRARLARVDSRGLQAATESAQSALAPTSRSRIEPATLPEPLAPVEATREPEATASDPSLHTTSLAPSSADASRARRAPRPSEGARSAPARTPRAKPAEGRDVVPSAVARPSDECALSYEVDALGRKHFKPECSKPRAAPAAGRSDARCNPSFELDARGRKRFKPECFLDAAR